MDDLQLHIESEKKVIAIIEKPRILYEEIKRLELKSQQYEENMTQLRSSRYSLEERTISPTQYDTFLEAIARKDEVEKQIIQLESEYMKVQDELDNYLKKAILNTDFCKPRFPPTCYEVMYERYILLRNNEEIIADYNSRGKKISDVYIRDNITAGKRALFTYEYLHLKG